MLVLVDGCSWMDRQLFSILLQVIKQDFSLSDTQLGLLGGPHSRCSMSRSPCRSRGSRT
jgi:hypothetical protein